MSIGTPPPPTSPRTRLTAGQRREQIVDAAIREFAHGGLAGASTEAIARRAGISHAYLFRLFATKRALFLACIESAHDRVLEVFAAAAAGDGPGPIQAKLGRAYRRLVEDRDVLMFQLHAFAVACGDDEVRDVLRGRYLEVFTWVQREGGLSPDAARLFMAQGLLINTAAALELPELDDHGRWERRATIAQIAAEKRSR